MVNSTNTNNKTKKKNTPFDFLYTQINKKNDILVRLNDGTNIECQLISFDNYTVLVKDSKTNKNRLIFKHSISDISE